MIKLYTQILLFLNCLTAFGFTTLPPTATISGGTTLCQNTTGSVITFTGSGGTAPYTFTYTVTGVSGNQTIVTSGTNNTVTLPIVTSVAGTFTYTLVSVSDSTTPAVVIPANGSTVVNVNTPPAVNFTFTNNNSCSGTAIQFTPTVSTPGSYTYLWDFGDGTPTSTSQNPNHSFTSLGCGTATFNVVLTVTGNGCSVTSTNSVSVKQKPDISFIDLINQFATDPFNNCSGASLSNQNFSITVGNTSTSTCISSFSINWGDGNNETNVTFPKSHSYTQIGVYTMTITAVGSNGCINTKTFIVKNVSNPLGGINSPGSTQNLCAPTTNLQFSISNWGTNSLDTTYNINYGDGSPPLILNQSQLNSSTFFNSTNPASSLNYPIPHTYTTSSCPGTSFIVTLDVTNACGTTPFTLGNISILTKPTANFTAPPNGCINSSITFNNTTISGYGQGCAQSSIYTWNFGDGTPIITTPLSPPTNINHTFSTPGTYNVTLTAQNGCGTTTISKTICIEPPLVPTFTLNTNDGCAPLSVTATNTTNTTSSCNTPTYLWQVTYSAGFCGTSITPIPNQTSANASFNFVESGTYLVRLTMTNSCGTFNSTQTVIVKKPPTVSIAPLTSFCGTATINPVATVTNCAPSGSTLTYAWSFPGGNPSTSTSPNPGPINYPSAGNYTVSLIVTNECGASNTASQTLVINQSPVITNTNLSQTICSGTATTPVNITTNPATATFSWTATATAGIYGFTPSGTTNFIPAQTISTTSNSVGTVTYVITPTIGTCTGASVSYIITVNPAAQVNQPAAVTVCNGNTVTPNSFTTSNTTAGTTYSWTNSNTGIGLAASGNGNIPTFAAVNATNTPINATITVTPSFSGGSAICSGVSRTFIITVNPTGQVNQPNNITNCNGSNVAVSFSSSNSGGTTSYSWTNDTTSIGLPSSGIGNLNFTSTNTTNASITATITITPTYTVGTLNCVGTPKTFTITINPSAQVNQPTAISVCNGSTIPTTNFSTQNTTGTTTYTWTNSNPAIGLAASGTGDIPVFTAVNNGTTILSATIIITPSILIGTTSCSGTTKQFAISVLPNANLVATTNKVICNGSTSPAITFSSTTTGGTTSYSWTNDTPSIGLAASGNGNIPIFTAINTGLSPITATISVTPSFTNGSLTCSGTPQTFTITVNPSAQVNTINNIEVCNGNTIPATVFSTSNLVGTTTYSWTNSNPAIGLATSGNGTIPSFTANNTTTAALISTVTVTPTFTHLGVSCTGPNKTFTIKVNPSPTATISGSVSVCLNATNPQITFTGSSGNAPYTFTYNLNGGTNQTISTTSGNSISINAPTNVVGTFTYNLINVQDSNATSCLNTLSQSAIVTVNNAPTINSQPLPTQSICVGGSISTPLSVTFQNGTGTASYQWYNNTTNSTTGGTLISGATSATFLPPVFNTAGTFYYYVVISFTGNGCGTVTSDVANVVVLPDPIVSGQPLATQTLCQSSTPTDLTISVSGGIGTISYQWYSNTTNSTIGGVLITGATNNTYAPTTTIVGTQYYYCVVTQSGVGCNVTSDVSQVIIVAAPNITTEPASSSVCENGTPTLLTVAFTNGTGTPTYQWFSNINNSTTGGTAIAGATAVSYNPPATALGTLYYYCEITFSSGGCTSILSNTAQVVINPLPTVSTQPLTTQNICVGGTTPLTVAYTGGVGTATYQWFSNNTNTNSGGTVIAGATNASYTPAAFTTVGTYYYYATITLSGNGCGNTTSSTAEVIVVADPIIASQALATQTLCQSSTPTDLTISVSGGIGTISYQWYSNTTNSTIGGVLITGATNNTYTPTTTTVGTQYYYCVVTQSGVGCNVTSDVSQVIIVAAPNITTEPASSSVCENGTPTLLTVVFTNGTGTPTYQWFSNTTNSTTGGTAIAGATSTSYSPPSTTVGTLYYYCEITFSSGGCTNVLSNTAQVVINPLPTVSTQPLTTQNICVGGTITPLTVAYTGGVGTATYQWFSNNTNTNSGGTAIAGAINSSYTPAAYTTAGTYYYYATITLSGNGCGNTTSSTAEVIVVADPIIASQALATQTLCQSSTPTDLTISVSGGIGTISYQWYSNSTNSTTGGVLITGATNNTYTPPTTTVGTQYYYCVVTQSGVGCNVTSAVSQVIIVAAPAITTQPASSSVCENGTPTLLTVTFTNGTGTPTYQWFSNTTNSTTGGTAIAGATAASYNPPAIAVGTLYYYCEITFSSGGCTSILSNTAQVVINQIPVVNNVTSIICSGEQYIFNSTNSNDVLPIGLQYSWNLISMTPAGTVSGSVNNGTLQNQFSQQLVNNSNGITTLVYEVTPIAGICTGNPFTITIEVYPRPDVTFDLPIQTICNETDTSLVTLNSSLPGNITYNWTATIPTGITGAISSGTNIIPVQTLINSTNVPLTITYSATATFNNNGSSCEGNVYTYSITVNPTFTSSGVVSNYNGYNVSVFGANDGSINLTTVGGSGTYTYNWSGPNGYTSSNEDISGLFAGTYTVTINDGYCAPIILTFTLTQPPELLIQPDLNLTINLICYGDNNGAVGVLITQESVPPYDYELYNSSGILVSSIIDSTNLNPQFTGLIAGVYSLKVIDANGGQKIVTGLTVTQPNDIIITVTTTPITCYGANNASITLTVTGGTGPYQAQWDNLATGFYQNNLAAGNYSILVTDNNGCTKTIVVNIPQAPIFTINPVVVNISCYGANDGSINLNLIGGIQPISLTWSDGSTAGLVRNNLVAGTYTVTIIDSKPCTIVRTFIIVEPQPLVLSANIQNALDCNNANSGAINLLVSGGTPPFTYSWTNGTTTEDLINIPSGNYAVVVTDSRGCTKTAQYSVNRPQPLTLNVETDTNVNCETREISQIFEAQVSGGVPPIQLNWSSGTVSGSNNEFMTTNQDGLVVLTATDALGCTTTYSLNVDIPVLGNASFNQTSFGYTTYGIYSILDPIQFTNTATGDYVSILWNFGDGTFSNEENPIHTYVLEGDYVVTQTVTYPFGCVYVHTISLLVEKGYLLVVPTGFTPNNDSLNDTYRPVTKGLKNVRLTIYDTWGSLIYSETGDVLRGWDGTIKGVNAENGNYHCKVSADTFYGSIIEAEETFVLIK